jgi:LysM repeat protein
VAVASGQAKAQEAAGKTYTVAPGDTLTRIASTLGVSIPELEKINGLASNSVLRVGQVLKVPEKGLTQQVAVPAAPVDAPAIPETAVLGTSAKNTPPEAASASASTPPDAPLAEYIVVKGDNPYKIAKRFKVSFEELMKVNGITDAKKIQIGQKLRIPAPAGKTKTAK